MAKYIIAYIVTIVISLLSLFVFGCLIGAVGVLFANPQKIMQSVQSGGLAILSQLAFLVIGFFSFRFSVQKFIEPKL